MFADTNLPRIPPKCSHAPLRLRRIVAAMSSDPAYTLACLCDLRDAEGRVLLLHRVRPPNEGMWSPIGGKLDAGRGESPAMSAQREIREEAGIDVPLDRLRLVGLWSEQGDPPASRHWLLFIYRVIGPVEVAARDIPEGRLAWIAPEDFATLPIAQADREILWPMLTDSDALRHPVSVHVTATAGRLTLQWRSR